MTRISDPALLLQLHQHLLEGERTASVELIRHLQMPLVRLLRSKFPTTNPDFLIDGVTDALLDFCSMPERFDRSREVPVLEYIRIAATRNVLNSIQAESRLRNREETAVEIFRLTVAEDFAARNMGVKDGASEQDAQGKLMQLLPNPIDRKILELRLAGEQRHEVFVKILDVGGLSLPEQRRRVKAAKDRIQKFLSRKNKNREEP